jgi:molybdate transport system permease protein
MDKAVINTVRYEITERRSNLNRNKFGFEKEKILLVSIIIIVFIYSVITVIPMVSIVNSAGLLNTLLSLKNSDNLSAIGISLMTTLLTVILSFLFGTSVVFILMNNKKSVFTKLLDMVVSIPTVLPPAVAGLGLLLVFGGNGFLGRLLENMGMDIIFTPAAVVLAQLFVASGFYIKVLKTAADAVEPEILEISYVLGAGKIETFFRIVIPMLKKPVAAGLILSWTRALGEFGATIMFAGNVLGKTRTMPLQIYTFMQTDITLAASLSAILLAMSFIMLFITKIWLEES